MVTAFRYFQVGVVARCELDALRRNKIGKWIVRCAWGRCLVNGTDNLFVLLWPSDGQYARMGRADHGFFNAHTARDNHASVFSDRFANCFERFCFCAVDKAAGVDDHHVGVIVVRHDLIAFSTQLGEDALRVY